MPQTEKNTTVKVINRAGPRGIVFLLTYIGAAIYFIQQTNGTFGEVVVGLLQALVWPVYLVFHVLQLLGA